MTGVQQGACCEGSGSATFAETGSLTVFKALWTMIPPGMVERLGLGLGPAIYRPGDSAASVAAKAAALLVGLADSD